MTNCHVIEGVVNAANQSRLEENWLKFEENCSQFEENRLKLKEDQSKLEENRFKLEENRSKFEENRLKLEKNRSKLKENPLKLEDFQLIDGQPISTHNIHVFVAEKSLVDGKKHEFPAKLAKFDKKRDLAGVKKLQF